MELLIILLVLLVLFGGVGYGTRSSWEGNPGYGLGGLLVAILVIYLVLHFLLHLV